MSQNGPSVPPASYRKPARRLTRDAAYPPCKHATKMLIPYIL
jgi:hypothetical protein